MNIRALDDFLIEKLESLFCYIDVSPYGIARNCWIGIGVLDVLQVVTQHLSFWFLFVLVFCALCVIANKSIERENSKGFINRRKKNWSFRYSSIVGLGFMIYCDIDFTFSNTVMVIWMILVVVGIYCETLNWWPPVAKKFSFKSFFSFGHN